MLSTLCDTRHWLKTNIFLSVKGRGKEVLGNVADNMLNPLCVYVRLGLFLRHSFTDNSIFVEMTTGLMHFILSKYKVFNIM